MAQQKWIILMVTFNSALKPTQKNQVFKYCRPKTFSFCPSSYSDIILHSFQGLINASIIFTCYLAVLNIPIGDALAIIFSSPVFTLILTFIILGHRHSLWKIIFAFIVFIGVVMIIKPPFLFGNTTATRRCQSSKYGFLTLEGLGVGSGNEH